MEESKIDGRRNDSFVEAFAKGLHVIRSFPLEKPFATLAEVATIADLPRATVRRMLLTLVELGYVTQQDDRFSLAPRLLDLGFSYLSSIPLYRTAQDVLERLASDLNELCSLSVLDGPETIYLVRVQGRDFLSRGMGVDTRLPVYATSMGRVLMADMDKTQRERLLRGTKLLKRTPKTIVDWPTLHARADAAKKDGFSLVIGELEEGIIGLSVPVKDRLGKVVATASISFNPVRFKKQEALAAYLPKLREAAEMIAYSVT